MSTKKFKMEAASYVQKVIAILVVLAVAIGSFMYSVLTRGGHELEIDVPFVNPTDEAYPSGPPSVAPPTTPPPNN